MSTAQVGFTRPTINEKFVWRFLKFLDLIGPPLALLLMAFESLGYFKNTKFMTASFLFIAGVCAFRFSHIVFSWLLALTHPDYNQWYKNNWSILRTVLSFLVFVLIYSLNVLMFNPQFKFMNTLLYALVLSVMLWARLQHALSQSVGISLLMSKNVQQLNPHLSQQIEKSMKLEKKASKLFLYFAIPFYLIYFSFHKLGIPILKLQIFLYAAGLVFVALPLYFFPKQFLVKKLLFNFRYFIYFDMTSEISGFASLGIHGYESFLFSREAFSQTAHYTKKLLIFLFVACIGFGLFHVFKIDWPAQFNKNQSDFMIQVIAIRAALVNVHYFTDYLMFGTNTREGKNIKQSILNYRILNQRKAITAFPQILSAPGDTKTG